MHTRTRLSRFLPVLLCFAAFLFSGVSARAEGEAPAPAPTPAPAPAASDPAKPAARKEDIEPKTLADAQGALKEARTDRDKAAADLAESQAGHTKTKELLSSTLVTAQKATTERDEARSQLATVTAERDKERTAHTATNERMTHLEALCDVRGIDPSKAAEVQPGNNTPGTHVYDQWAKADGAEKTRLWREHRQEIRAEGERRAAANR